MLLYTLVKAINTHCIVISKCCCRSGFCAHYAVELIFKTYEMTRTCSCISTPNPDQIKVTTSWYIIARTIVRIAPTYIDANANEQNKLHVLNYMLSLYSIRIDSSKPACCVVICVLPK